VSAALVCHLGQIMDPLLLFFILQLERIKQKPTVHAVGPRKPTLAQIDLGKLKVK